MENPLTLATSASGTIVRARPVDQLQSLRLYYQFLERRRRPLYHQERYRKVMLSAREYSASCARRADLGQPTCSSPTSTASL